MTGVRRCWIAALAICATFAGPPGARAEGILVFAAASLKTALDDVAEMFEKQSGRDITISYAASSSLARQIQNGAPADLFISANTDWMDLLEDEGWIDASSRVDLLGNGLVLVGVGERAPVALTPEFDLLAGLDDGFLAMALIDAVPAGIYGKAALQNLGLWSDVQDQIAQADNVRAALALVAVGAAPLGIVYRSDAIAEDRVSVVGHFPQELHPPIIYPAALTQTGDPEALAFLSFLQEPPARAHFLRQGFTLPGG